MVLTMFYPTLLGRKTIAERLDQYGPAARERMWGDFEREGVAYPPASVVLVGLKRERVLHVYVAADPAGGHRLVRSYPVRGASGALGPKLREGDRQVPEGVYPIESLNPNSRFHLSLRVGYPNEFDRAMARRDGRERLGSDIMIHGGSASVGCLAVGDEAAEDLFVLTADAGRENVRVILAPLDLRTQSSSAGVGASQTGPPWVVKLYGQVRGELARLERPAGAASERNVAAPDVE